MPKKRQHLKSFKPSSSTASPTSVPSSSSSSEKTQRSVNELLANLRRAPADPSLSSLSSSSSSRHAITPTVPPALREILQIPETPPPAPRRPLRARLDANGRRLPAGPPPPRSWLAARDHHNTWRGHGPTRTSKTSRSGVTEMTLPDVYYPSPGSLIGTILGKLAADWAFHRVYDQYHLYFIPNHLKPALIRCLGAAHGCGLSLADLKLILFPPIDPLDDEDCPCAAPDLVPNAEIRHLDLTGSIGRSISIKEMSELLQLSKKVETSEEPQDSWDAADPVPSPPRALLPNLTHLSLALDPHCDSSPSWKQLLALSSHLSSITHLSLANWPDPCLTPQARYSTISTPQGINVPYGGTNLYSHSIDHDWSEALLVLRMLSKNLYALEFLDLTGCGPWFPALMKHSEHDFVDWSGSWGKITELRLYVGWSLGEDSMPSERESYREIVNTAAIVGRHIRTMRAGRGRFMSVERDVQVD